jgi:ribosome-associated translation inhibitor RaiA
MIVPKRLRLTPAVRDHLERRLHFALAKFSPAIRDVRIGLSDENGPRGGVDKRCRVLMTLSRGDRLVVEGRGEQLEELLDRTLERAGRAAARAVQRRHDRSGIRRAQEMVNTHPRDEKGM